jgi:TfoX/Sxy family transcriptional regulator of competence genes
MPRKNGKPTNNGTTERLPKASDFKLPKNLSEIDKKIIELGRKINKSLHQAYLNEQNSKKQKAAS